MNKNDISDTEHYRIVPMDRNIDESDGFSFMGRMFDAAPEEELCFNSENIKE